MTFVLLSCSERRKNIQHCRESCAAFSNSSLTSSPASLIKWIKPGRQKKARVHSCGASRPLGWQVFQAIGCCRRHCFHLVPYFSTQPTKMSRKQWHNDPVCHKSPILALESIYSHRASVLICPVHSCSSYQRIVSSTLSPVRRSDCCKSLVPMMR